jgi:hypothetical protein
MSMKYILVYFAAHRDVVRTLCETGMSQSQTLKEL